MDGYPRIKSLGGQRWECIQKRMEWILQPTSLLFIKIVFFLITCDSK